MSIHPQVAGRLSYVDSVALLLPENLPHDTYAALVRALGSPKEPRKRIVPDDVPRPDWVGGFHLVTWVHQPTPAALEVLERHKADALYAVHVAHDLRVGDESAIGHLRAHVERRLVKNYTPARLSHTYEGTRYIGCTTSTWENPETGERGSSISRRGTELAVYSDEPSKVLPQVPCVHVEYRATGAEDVRRQFGNRDGVLALDHHASWEGIRALDHIAFWDKRLHLLRPPPIDHVIRAAAERILRFQGKAPGARRSKRKDRLAMAEESVREAFAVHGVQYESALASDILYVLRQGDPLLVGDPVGVFGRERHDWLLPTNRVNALWPQPLPRVRRPLR